MIPNPTHRLIHLLLIVAVLNTAHYAAVPRAGTFPGMVAPDAIDHNDPCEQAATVPGKGKGLEKRCVRTSSSGVTKGDFNGDGFADLAIGVPNEAISSVSNGYGAGAVNVIYGSQAGLDPDGAPGVPVSQFWSLASADIQGVPFNADYFGRAIASGDFNGDGYSDMAVGSRNSGAGYCGAVNVIYGSPAGLATSNPDFPPPQRWTQDSDGIVGASENHDEFGSSLAWGDFNNDGFGDLAIGVPREDVGSIEDAGAINVLYGTQFGLSSLNNQQWTENTLGVPDSANVDDGFGEVLSGGDYNNDGNDDLAIGAPEDVGGVAIVIYGSHPLGLTTTTSGIPAAQLWTQNSTFVADSVEGGDDFGAALASGDFNGDGFADLAIGVPGETLLNEASDEIVDAGAVNVIYGRSGGLSTTASPVPGTTIVTTQFWTQDSAMMPDAMEAADQFGTELAAGDLNGDGYKDLIIGTPLENLEDYSAIDAGAVFVIFGSQFRLSTTTLTPVELREPSISLLSPVETYDRFGGALSSWNFGNGAPADLAIGASGNNLDGFDSAGTVSVIYGSSGQFFGGRLFSQSTPGVPDSIERDERFGAALY